ncbi:serine hydrolase [Acetobacter fabarum]|uniref:serine hydrolase domain-containing protein n=1 Tax=Acetobacter fabarum TaxID=483199 RepID=UPI00312B488B
MPFRTPLTRRKALLAGLTQATCLAGLYRPTYAQQTQPAPFAPVEEIFRKAIQKGKTPGVVAAIGHEGQVVWRGVFGQRSVLPQAEAMTWDTLFDMASLTKVLITAPAVMQFYERGLIALDTPACHYLPAFAANGKQDITIRQLLTHYSGLAPDLNMSFAWQGKQTGVQMLMNCTPQTPPDVQFAYSDLNFITLGLIVERLSGQSLDAYAMEHILKPLGLHNSFFLPAPSYQSTIAPTEYDENGHMLRGIVHDPLARRMGGVAGHAGLFSCAQDTITYSQSILNKLAGLPSDFPLKAETLHLMSTPQQPAGKTDLRGLGWDIATHYSTPRGAYFPSSSFGHTGFTGTSLWLVPNTRSFVVILTNRLHPHGQGTVVSLRGDVATAAALALRSMEH